MATNQMFEAERVRWSPRDAGVHIIVALAMVACFFIVTHHWGQLVSDVVPTFGTIGFFLTFYGVIFAIIEVMRTQSTAAIAAAASQRGAVIARVPYDTRDLAECITTIEASLYAMQRGSAPRSQPLARVVRLYTAVFEDRYDDAVSAERMRISIVQSYISSRSLGKDDARLCTALAEMLGDLAARGKRAAVEVKSR